MPVNPLDIEELLDYTIDGVRLAVCEYLRVDWDGSTTKYYGSAAWHEMLPFTGIGVEIEPRLMPSSIRDPFHGLEIDPDLRTESIAVTFDDIDKDITDKFQTYSSGVACEFFLYYPIINLTVSVWSGQLQAPTIYGWKTVKATASNGFRSRELLLGSRRRPRECTASVFGGRLPDADAVRSSLCPYDRHIGGSVGNLTGSSTPYIDCPKTETACIERFSDNRYFGGFNTDASATVTDTNHYYLATSKGNASNLKEPIRVIFGTKTVKANQLLQWRREVNANTPAHGWVATVWEIGEGPMQSIYNFRVNEKMIEQMHLGFRLGTRGQSRLPYASQMSNYSSTAVVFARYGWVDPLEITPADLNSDCMVQGFNEVCVYTNASTKTRIFSNNRVWCLLEIYKNQKFGLGYAESRFEIDDWITAADWTEDIVSHTFTFPDGEESSYVSQRSTLNAIVEGRPVGEVIEDICRSGAISVPFEHEGKFTVAAFRVATSDELTDARIFTDTGEGRNICWDGGQPMVDLSQVPDNKLTNEVEVRFEEAANGGTERPVIVDDPNQKLKAGRQLGPDYSLSVPKKFTGFGIDGLAEALRMAYRLLKFGQFDEGGTDNNLRLTLTVPFEYALGIKRYDIIKFESELLDPFTIGYGALAESPEYFRVLSLKKQSGGRCEITAQAYNHTAYSAFETAGVLPGYSSLTVSGAGSTAANNFYYYNGEINDKGSYIATNHTIAWTGGEWNLTDSTGTLLYTSLDNTDYPWEAVWTVSSGVSPAPTVTRGIGIIIGGCELTLGTASYNATTQTLIVPINPC